MKESTVLMTSSVETERVHLPFFGGISVVVLAVADIPTTPEQIAEEDGEANMACLKSVCSIIRRIKLSKPADLGAEA